MTKLRTPLCITLLSLSLACGDKASTTNDAKPSAPGGAPSAAATASGSAKAQCLLSYQHKFDELLPLATAAEVVGLPAAEAKTKYQNDTKRTLKQERRADLGFNKLEYAWPSDRIEEINAGPVGGMKIPVKNLVVLSNMSTMDKAYFERSYRAITDEEAEALKAKTKEQLEKEPKVAGASTEANNMAVDALGGAMKEISAGFREVSGVGEVARWNIKERLLYVLVDGVKIQVGASISADDDKNKEAALAVFQKVMARCP